MERNTFDPERDVVVKGQIDGNLVPAQSVSVVTDFGPTLTVGRMAWSSLLVLALELSGAARSIKEQGGRALWLCNLQQTGLLFDEHCRRGYHIALASSVVRNVIMKIGAC